MGYHLSSIFAVSPNDKHSYFIYFKPGWEFETDWVNQWINTQFTRIAGAMGPKAVIIAPSPNHDDVFLAELLELRGTGGCLFHSCYSKITNGAYPDSQFKREERMFHGEEPLLLISRTPLQKEASENQAIVVPLSDCMNERCLGRVIDILLDTIKNDDLNKLNSLKDVLAPSKKQEDEKLGYLDALELKPNFMGLGVNFNFLLRKIAEKTIARTKEN